MKTPNLSKTRYISGTQCTLKLWYDCFERELAAPVDAAQQAIFDTGNAVGELARERYKGGTLIEFDHFHVEQALAQTAELMRDPGVPAIYEAAFRFRKVVVRVDVLEREGAGWNMVEVKSGTKFKTGVHDIDVAVQLWVLLGTGLKVINSGLLTLNRDYVFDGESLDLKNLFSLHDCTAIAQSLLPEVEQNIARYVRMLSGDAAPKELPGYHCFKPYTSPYYGHCTKDAVFAEHPVTELPRIARKHLDQMAVDDIDEIVDIPEDFPLNKMQQRVREVVSSGVEYISQELGEALKKAEYPIYYLDFEAFSTAIPMYSETRPYDSIPFQYSVHIEQENDDITHLEFLHTLNNDPREQLAINLLKDLGDSGSICVYSNYESRVISALAKQFPEYAKRLRAIVARLWDLLPVVNKHYYHADFRGSFSIKKTLPVLAPKLGYGELAIQDGRLAGVAYVSAIASTDDREKQTIFDDLKAYCGTDTEAMIYIRRALEEKYRQRYFSDAASTKVST